MVQGLVSIIIPAYNVEKYIQLCIESVCQQTYSQLEIIVVNDGSKDDTENIICNLEKKDSRICYISQENAGLPSARNTGLSYSNGEYIMFLDADDWLEPECCELVLGTMRETNSDVIIFDYNKIIKNESFKHNAYSEEMLIYEKNKENNFFIYDMRSITAWGKLYRKASIDGILFDPNMRTAEDVDFNFRVYNQIHKAIYIQKHLLNYRILDSSAIHGYDQNIVEKMEYPLQRMKEYMNHDDSQKKAYYSFAGIAYILICQNGICLNGNISFYEKYKKIKFLNSYGFIQNLFQHTQYLVMPLSRKLFIYCGKWHLSYFIIAMINIKKRFKNL